MLVNFFTPFVFCFLFKTNDLVNSFIVLSLISQNSFGFFISKPWNENVMVITDFESNENYE